jgi:hypothetical protein
VARLIARSRLLFAPRSCSRRAPRASLTAGSEVARIAASRSPSRKRVRPSSRLAARTAARMRSTGVSGAALSGPRSLSSPAIEARARRSTSPFSRRASRSFRPTSATSRPGSSSLPARRETTMPAGPAATTSLESARDSSDSRKSRIWRPSGTSSLMGRPVSLFSSVSARARRRWWSSTATFRPSSAKLVDDSTSARPSISSRSAMRWATTAWKRPTSRAAPTRCAAVGGAAGSPAAFDSPARASRRSSATRVMSCSSSCVPYRVFARR